MEINKIYNTNIRGMLGRVIYLGYNQNKGCHVVGLDNGLKNSFPAGFLMCRIDERGCLELNSEIDIGEITNAEREYVGGLFKKIQNEPK